MARYFLCICISILIAVLYALALGVLESCKPHTTTRIISYFSAECSTASGLFSGLIMAPFVEEQIFRGLIFGKLKNLCPVWIAAGFSAILFGLWHRNLAQFVGTVPTGLILAFVYHQTGRLRYAMVCHNLSNLLMFLAVVKKGVLPNIPFLHTMQEKIVYQLPLPLDLISLLCLHRSLFGFCGKCFRWYLNQNQKKSIPNLENSHKLCYNKGIQMIYRRFSPCHF